jgi:hypothetical protein
LQKKKTNPTCVLTPNASITIEEEKINMCFANDMQKLHTLYLSYGKQFFFKGITSLVLMGFWCLWRYYGLII